MPSTVQELRVETKTPVPLIGLAFAAGFFFAFRIVIVLFCVRIAGTEPRTGSEIILLLNFLLLVLVCFHSIGYAGPTSRSIMELSTVRWVLIFLAFSFCSLAWSGTVSPLVSFAYWCGMAADVATVLILLRAGPMIAVSHSLLKGFIYGACCIALIAWIMPAEYDLRLGEQDFFNANQIGNLCAFGIFFAQYLMRRKEGRWVWAMLLLAITLIRSLSKATIAAFLLSQGFLLIKDRAMSRKTKIIIASGLVVVILVFWGLFEAYYDIYTTTGNQAETLTGRTAIWLYVSSAALEHPWIGHGFDSMWKVIPPFGPDRFEARHAENELLQQFYAYGLAGVCMLVGLYGSFFRQVKKMTESSLRTVFLCLLFFVIVRGVVEAEPFDLLFPLWAVVVVALLAERAHSIPVKVAALTPAIWGHSAASVAPQPPSG